MAQKREETTTRYPFYIGKELYSIVVKLSDKYQKGAHESWIDWRFIPFIRRDDG
ncbi:MAG: hypothetical protein LBQ52_05770 [Helicobacteraceae bacterium]|nr:hypothetical protein [Helicobacteraceae bacterium]